MIEVNHDDLILRTFILFVQTARAAMKYADAHFYKKARLSVIRFIVLRVIASKNGVMTPSEIAEWTQTERHNITALINRMKRDGFVRTERNQRDRRSTSVILTDRGREAINLTLPVAREVVAQVMLSIAESDALLLEKLLTVLRQNAHGGLERVAGQASHRVARTGAAINR